jgi:hypothetical protein
VSSINPGDAVRIAVTFTDSAVAAADPTTVTLRIRPKGGTEQTFVYQTNEELEKDSTGNYHLDYVIPEIAPHRGLTFYYEWKGTGAVAVVEPGTFSVTDPYNR